MLMRSRISFLTLFMLTSLTVVQIFMNATRHRIITSHIASRGDGGEVLVPGALYIGGVFVILPGQQRHFLGFHVLHFSENPEQHLAPLLDGGLGEVLGLLGG